MGNPQERELVWLAAMIEAEGSITFQTVRRDGGRIIITPFVCFVNSDALLLSRVRGLLTRLAVDAKSRPRSCGFARHSSAKLPCSMVRVDGEACQPVLEAILPFMVGAKRRNAKVVLRYLASRKRRLLLRRNRLGQVLRNGYSLAEIKLVTSIRTHISALSSETLRQAVNVGRRSRMITSDLPRDRQSAAETTAPR
jgi:hypothetical protein